MILTPEQRGNIEMGLDVYHIPTDKEHQLDKDCGRAESSSMTSHQHLVSWYLYNYYNESMKERYISRKMFENNTAVF